MEVEWIVGYTEVIQFGGLPPNRRADERRQFWPDRTRSYEGGLLGPARLLDEQGQKTQPVFAVQNTRSGLDQLGQELAALDGTVMVGLEATGHYWLSLYDVLTRQGYAVVVINPFQVSAYRKSGVRKLKTDRTDAIWIADFLRIAHLPATSRDIPALLQLRELSRSPLLALGPDR